MKFTCDGCGKRYVTAQQPAPGRVYRITCKACGHLVEVRAPSDGAAMDAAGDDLPSIPVIVDPEEPLAEPGAAAVPAPPPAQPTPGSGAGAPEAGYVDLFADPPRGETGAVLDPFVPPPDQRPVRTRATPTPEIPRPPPRRRAGPLALIGAGAVGLIGILAFVLLRGNGAPPGSAPPGPPPAAVVAPEAVAVPAPPPPSAPGAKPAPRRDARPADRAGERASREARARAERDARKQAPPEAGREAPRARPLTPAEVQQVLSSSRAAFERCVQEAARSDEVRLDGRRVVLRLNVQRTGAVTYPTLDDVTLNGTELGTCLKGAARGMTFPRFTGDPMRVELPLVLARRK